MTESPQLLSGLLSSSSWIALAEIAVLESESGRRAGRDQLNIILLCAGGNQDHRRPVASLKAKLAGEVETALTAKIDVDQGDIRAELRSASQRLGTVGCQADNCDALTLQKVSGSAEEPMAVVDNQTAQRHGSRLQGRGGQRIPASWRSSRRDLAHRLRASRFSSRANYSQQSCKYLLAAIVNWRWP